MTFGADEHSLPTFMLVISICTLASPFQHEKELLGHPVEFFHQDCQTGQTGVHFVRLNWVNAVMLCGHEQKARQPEVGTQTTSLGCLTGQPIFDGYLLQPMPRNKCWLPLYTPPKAPSKPRFISRVYVCLAYLMK